MEYFVNAFLMTAGIILALVLFQAAPTLIMAGLCRLTTRKWQARKYRSLVARGQVGTAQWAAAHGFATEE